MTHRLLPLAPGRTWIECSWLVAPGADGAAPDARGARRLLGPDQQAGLGGLRVGAARARQPALPARAVRAERGRRHHLVATIGRAYQLGRLQP